MVTSRSLDVRFVLRVTLASRTLAANPAPSTVNSVHLRTLVDIVVQASRLTLSGNVWTFVKRDKNTTIIMGRSTALPLTTK